MICKGLTDVLIMSDNNTTHLSLPMNPLELHKQLITLDNIYYLKTKMNIYLANGKFNPNHEVDLNEFNPIKYVENLNTYFVENYYFFKLTYVANKLVAKTDALNKPTLELNTKLRAILDQAKRLQPTYFNVEHANYSNKYAMDKYREVVSKIKHITFSMK